MPKFVVQKKSDDPQALRASIGGGNFLDEQKKPMEGYYCVYRGDKAKVVEMLGKVLAFLEQMPPGADEADSSVLGS